MRQAVLDRFVEFTTPLEGNVPSMYLDVKGLVTVALGCLIDPVQMAISLPWVLPDGSSPSAAEIANQWRVLKARQDLSKLHWKYAAALTTIRLTDEGVLELAKQRLLANEKVLRTYLPAWDSFPADAQLACCSMAWAIGAGWPRIFGNLKDAANRQDWTGAMASCAIKTDGNPGIVPRNAANKLCFANAAAVVRDGLDLDVLHWPDTVPNASQRDRALKVEASTIAADYAAGLDAITAALSSTGHSGSDITDYENGPNPPTDTDNRS